MTTTVLERELTELDFARLRKLAAAGEGQRLGDLLANADVVPGREVDADVITMYARFELEDLESGERRLLALCYPEDADPAAGRISVLSPLGISLVGLRAGAVVPYQRPGGARMARVHSVLFQPEATGDYLT